MWPSVPIAWCVWRTGGSRPDEGGVGTVKPVVRRYYLRVGSAGPAQEAFLTPLSASSTTHAPSSPDLPARTKMLCGQSEDSIPARLVDVGKGRPVVFLHGLVGLNDHWE